MSKDSDHGMILPALQATLHDGTAICRITLTLEPGSARYNYHIVGTASADEIHGMLERAMKIVQGGIDATSSRTPRTTKDKSVLAQTGVIFLNTLGTALGIEKSSGVTEYRETLSKELGIGVRTLMRWEAGDSQLWPATFQKKVLALLQAKSVTEPLIAQVQSAYDAWIHSLD